MPRGLDAITLGSAQPEPLLAEWQLRSHIMRSAWWQRFMKRALLPRGQHQNVVVTHQRTSPLQLEVLEGRLVPATHTWTGAGADLNWSTAANWTGGVPTSGETGG